MTQQRRAALAIAFTAAAGACCLVECGGAPPAGWRSVARLDGSVALAVWGAADDDVWVVGGGLGAPGAGTLIARFQGGTRVDVPAAWTTRSETLWWVSGRAEGDVWLVGEKALVLHFDGTQLAPVARPDDAAGATLFGVWEAAPGDVWAVGGTPDVSPLVLHGGASGFTRVAAAEAAAGGAALFKVWGRAPNDVWFVGQAGRILHFDGQTFTAEPSDVAAGTTLFTVAGAQKDAVYAVGGAGTDVLERFDGARWSAVADAALSGGGLAGLSVGEDGRIVAVGSDGHLLVGAPGTLVDEPSPTREDLHAAWLSPGGVAWAVGGNYLAPTGTRREGVVLQRSKD